jgi:IAA-amino acid hydrolase
MRRLFGPEQVQEVEPIMPREDFSFFLEKVPGAMLFLGHRSVAAGSGAALHSPAFVLDEEMLARGAALHAQLALAYLQSGGFNHTAQQRQRPPDTDEL